LQSEVLPQGLIDVLLLFFFKSRGKEADSSVPVRRRKVLIRELARVREQLWDS